MHAAIPSGGRSPKPLNGPTNPQQLKSGLESLQNSRTSSPSHSKSRKRDRGDQGSESVKREQFGKPDDGDSSGIKYISMIKEEIAKITERGGLTSTKGAEKLVNLMQLDRMERKIDVSGRILITEVIAATERCNDCLSRILQLRGLPILDDWLQEAYKGRTGDGSSPKENDKAFEELLLSLLRALDKLPVDLHALQSCNIGKSVNHLRTYKNVEIHKKAKSLVDTWKKRVDAEMTKINDAKSAGQNQPASCPAKTNFPDSSQAGNRRGGATDGSFKGPVTQSSACKTLAGKPGNLDQTVKYLSVHSDSLKSCSSLPYSTGPKEQLSKVPVTSVSYEMLSAVKEERSSSSSQSQNNSQSCSSDHGKVVGSSWKEDAKSSTTGSLNSVKDNGCSSQQRRPSNGPLGASPGVQMESNQGKASSLSLTSALERASQSEPTCEKSLDTPASELGNNHKFIVKFTNPGRIPVPNACGGYLEDRPVTRNRISSTGTVDRHEHSDRRMKTRSDACRSHVAADANAELCQSSDFKEGLLGADVLKSQTTIIDEEYNKTVEDSGKPKDSSRNSFLSPCKVKSAISEPRMRDSFSSINALIESCAKYSEVSVPLDVGDDIGMNLLASVAAGEISISDLTSPSGSPRASPAAEDPLSGNNEIRSRLSFDEDVAQSHVQSDEAADADSASRGKSVGSVFSKDESIRDIFSSNSKTSMIFQDEKAFSEQIEKLSVSSKSPHRTGLCHKSEEKCQDGKNGSLPVSKSLKVEENADGASETDVEQMTDKNVLENYIDCKPSTPVPDGKKPIVHPQNACSSDFPRIKVDDAHEAVITADILSEKLVVEDSPSLTTKKILGGPCSIDQRSLVPMISTKTDAVAKNAGDSKTCESDSLESGQMKVNTDQKPPLASFSTSAIDELAREVASSIRDTVAIDRRPAKKAFDSCQTEIDSQEPCGSPVVRGEHHSLSFGCKVSGTSVDLREEFPSSIEATSVSFSAEPNASTKLDFDLNEGILADDGNQGEPATSAQALPTSVFLPSLHPCVNSTLNNLSMPITVAAPAKGPFVPLENLLKSKGEHGWKGSAATSAFRPAEPRRVPDMVIRESDVPLDTTVKLGRVPLDIDLNVADDRAIEEFQNTAHATESRVAANCEAPMKVVSGLDLDLNQIDGDTEGQLLVNTYNKPGVPHLPVRSTSAGFPNGETNVSRDFDLNNGPSLDGVCGEQVTWNQHLRNSNSALFLPAVVGIRMNNPELGSFATWFPPGKSYSPVAIPSFLPDRREQNFPIVSAPGAPRILGSVTGGGTLGGDIYRGPVLSSSPAMAFSPATAFSYAGFPFGSNSPLPSTFSVVSTSYVDSSPRSNSGFGSIPSQIVGPGAVSSHYPRPFVISIPEGSSNVGSDNNRKWGRQSLDLNAGPGGADIEGKDERPSLVSRQHVATSQAFSEEHAKMYGAPGVSLKRKEPERSWDAERSYKQHTWQ